MPSPVLARRLITPFRSKLLAEYAVNGFFGGITTSRATALWLPNASESLVEYGAGEVGIVDGDSIWCQPEATNKNTNYNADPTDTTGLSDGAGSPISNGWVTVVDDDSDLATAGLDGVVSKVIKVDIPSGEASGDYILLVDGQTGNTNDHTVSIYAKKESGKTFFRMGLAAQVANVDVDGSGYFRYDATITPGATTRQMAFGVSHANGEASTFYFCLNQMEESAYVTPPIVVGGSTDAAGPTESVIPWPNGLDSNFAGSFVWTPAAASQGTIWLLGNYTDADNAFGVLHNGTNIIFRNRVSGSNNDATKALAYSADTEYLIHFRHDSLTGLDIAVDRTKGTNDSTTTAVTSAANCEVGSDGNTANHTIGKVKEIKIQKTYPGFSDAAWLAL